MSKATETRADTYERIVRARHCTCPTRAHWEDPFITPTMLARMRESCPLHSPSPAHDLPPEFP